MPRPIETIADPSLPVSGGIPDLSAWCNERSATNEGTPTHDGGPAALTTHADDGAMGGAYLDVMGFGEPSNGTIFKPLFDWRLPIAWSYRVRLNGVAVDGYDDWQGPGVLYCGQGAGYNGLSSGYYGLDDFMAWDGTQPYDVELEWRPDLPKPAGWSGTADGYIRVRWKRAIDSTFGAWVPIPWAAGHTTDSLGDLRAWYPPALWFGQINPLAFNVSRMSATGRRMWGHLDHMDWRSWEFSANAGFAGGIDGNDQVGGVSWTPTDAPSHHYLGSQTIGPGGPLYSRPGEAFWAKSPGVGVPSGYRYSQLLFDIGPDGARFTYGRLPSRTNQGGSARVYLRDATTDELLPDSEVPGNSGGLVSTPLMLDPAITTDRRQSIRVLDLSGVQYGRSFYIDFQGTTPTSSFYQSDSPRLGFVAVAFDALALTVGDPVVSGSTATLGGFRAPGTTITVT